MLSGLFSLAAMAASFGPQSIQAVETGRIFSPQPAPLQRFGSRLSLWGGTLVVGVPEDDEGATNAGAVYVFTRTPSGWALQTKLIGTQAIAERGLGFSVSIHEETLAAGALRGGCVGSVHVFHRNGTTWNEEAILFSPITDCENCTLYFGWHVSVWDERLWVAEWDGNGNCAPSAYGYLRSGGTWTQDGMLSSLQYASSTFDWPTTMKLGEDTLVFSGARDSTPGIGLYVHRRVGASWPLEAEITYPFGGLWPSSPENFSFEGDTVVVAQPAGEGACYVFGRNAGVWTFEQVLTASDAGPLRRFGRGGTTMSGDSLVVMDDPEPSTGLGATLYFFQRTGATWSEVARQAFSALSVPPVTPVGGIRLQGDQLALSHAQDPTLGAQAGSVSVFALVRQSSFCDASDGSLAACPCANPGAPDTGCDLASGTGGVRLALADLALAPTPQATLTGTGFAPAGQATIIPIRSNALDLGAPIVFGDGLRCVGVPLARLTATQASGGSSAHFLVHDAGRGEFHYQLWFRDNPAAVCTPAAFNLSNGLTIVWP